MREDKLVVTTQKWHKGSRLVPFAAPPESGIKANVKVSELTGALLDFWVAMAEGVEVEQRGRRFYDRKRAGFNVAYQPSSDWWQGGPIIDRERISVCSAVNGLWWWATSYDPERPSTEAGSPEHIKIAQKGDSVLIAAMRAYVASRFGDEVPDAA